MNNTETNPNDYESAINNMVKLWAELKTLMENPDPKNRGVTQALLSGRIVYTEQYSKFSQLTRDIGYELVSLARSRPLTPEEKAENEKAEAEAKARRDAYVSSLQQFVNNVMAEYVKERGLSEELLGGGTQEFRFKYYETERNYRSDSEVVKLPVALLRHFEQADEEADILPGWLVDQISSSGEEYELFNDIESCDSELVESTIEFDKVG